VKKYLLGIFIAVIFFIVQIVTLSSYGLDPDLPFHFLRGQAYLWYLTTGKQQFSPVNFPSPVLFAPGQRISNYVPNAWEGATDVIRPIAEYPEGESIQDLFKKYEQSFGRQTFYQHNSWNVNYFNNDQGHPPVSDILSAATNRIFYEKLGLLPDIEAYHLYGVLCASLLIFMVFVFTKNTFGEIQAVFASISLALFPFFFAESHFNIKDIPEMAFFASSLISFYFWVNSKKKTWFLAFTFFFFLGLGTKANIVFLPFILFIWLFSIIKTPVFKKWFSAKLIFYLAIFIAVNFGLLYLTWPYLWSDTSSKIISLFDFYKSVGARDPRIQASTPFLLANGANTLGLILTVATTPLITLTFLFIGFFVLLKSVRKMPQSVLVLTWFSVPILRVIFLSTDIFSSIRQYAEFLPALTVMVGVGGAYLINKLAAVFKKSKKLILAVVLTGYFSYLLYIQISFYPNQNVYFNSLVGGTSGAWQNKIIDWQTSNGNVYRQAVRWLNTYAPTGAKLAFLDGTMQAISPLWLRDDILIGSYFSGLWQKGEFIISLVYPTPPKVFPYLYLERFLEPVYEIKVGGITIVKIWENDPRYMKTGYKNIQAKEIDVTTTFGQDNAGQFWQIRFDKEYKLVSVTLKTPSDNCQKKDGLFFLDDFFVPFRIDEQDLSEFFFPAPATSSLRFYPLVSDSCFFSGKVTKIKAVEL